MPGSDSEALEQIQKIYERVIEVGTHSVSTIKTAEAIKVVENSQRDINIAFMNELAMVFDRMNIDTNEVVDGMNTKWNALGFRPGLVGGHCIGVDPYYFTYEAEKLGYHSQIILSGRKVNDGMGAFVADAAIKQMIIAGKSPKSAKVVILGLTFKENCPDTRNSKVADIIKRLKEYEISPVVVDPWATEQDAKTEYDVDLKTMSDVKNADCIIIAVAHNEFKAMTLDDINNLYKDIPQNEKILIDVKGLYKVSDLKKKGTALLEIINFIFKERCYMKLLHINCNYLGTPLHQIMAEHLTNLNIENHIFVPTDDKTQTVIKPNSNVTVSECFAKWDRLVSIISRLKY